MSVWSTGFQTSSMTEYVTEIILADEPTGNLDGETQRVENFHSFCVYILYDARWLVTEQYFC